MNALRPERRKDRNKDAESMRYMQFVKTLPCIVCFKNEWLTWSVLDLFFVGPGFQGCTEAAHIGGNMAAKASNWSCVPLCVQHHRTGADGQEKLKGMFWRVHGIEYKPLLEKLHEAFREAN